MWRETTHTQLKQTAWQHGRRTRREPFLYRLLWVYKQPRNFLIRTPRVSNSFDCTTRGKKTGRANKFNLDRTKRILLHKTRPKKTKQEEREKENKKGIICLSLPKVQFSLILFTLYICISVWVMFQQHNCFHH
jgi:hypothetical protein